MSPIKSVRNPRDSERCLYVDGSLGKASNFVSCAGTAASSFSRREVSYVSSMVSCVCDNEEWGNGPAQCQLSSRPRRWCGVSNTWKTPEPLSESPSPIGLCRRCGLGYSQYSNSNTCRARSRTSAEAGARWMENGDTHVANAYRNLGSATSAGHCCRPQSWRNRHQDVNFEYLSTFFVIGLHVTETV
jgi:hypothetical protein